MHISFNTEELSNVDLAVLRVIANGGGGGQDAEKAVSGPKTAPKSEGQVKPKPQPEKAAPEAEKTEADDTADAVDAAQPEHTMKDAVALATRLVSEGKAAQVKKALTDLGAKRVSELAESDVPTFIAALS